MAEPVVSVVGVVKRYGDSTALDGLSFEVQAGEVFVLLGAKGSGKTSTIEILGGAASPTSGTVNVLGSSVSDPAWASEVKRRVAMLPKVLNTHERMALAEDLKLLANVYDASLDVMGLLDLPDAQEKAKARFPNPFGGQKQVTGIAAALASDPEIILLDDPAAGLGLEVRRLVWNLIRYWHSRGKTIILATPDPLEAEQLADRIGVLTRGKIMALGAPAGLLGRFGEGRAIVFRNGGDSVFGTLRRFFDAVSMEGPDIVLPFDRLRDLEVALTALVERGLEIDFTLRTPSMEDVFQKILRSETPATSGPS